MVDAGTTTGGDGAAASTGGVGDNAAPDTTGAGTTQAADAGATSSGTGQSGAGDGAPAYTPNYKYKALKEEKEIPEWARGIVTSADSEKQVRELFERADGLDPVKQHRDILVNENKQFREHVLPFYQEAQQALDHARKGDLDSFFQTVGLSEAAILKYALHRIQLRDKPEALAAHDQARELRLQNATLQQQVEAANQQYTQYAVQQKSNELESTLSKPEISEAVQAFDARMGKPGAFRAEVIRRAQAAYAATQQDPTAEEAVGEMLRLIGWQGGGTSGQPPAQNGQNAGTADGGTFGASGAGAKPTLPSIRGKGGSPAKKVPRSVEDLRKLGREKMGL